MPFQPTPNCARSAIRQSLFGQDVINTLWFAGPDPWTISDLTNLNAALAGWWGTFLAPHLSSDIKLEDITSTSQESALAPSVTTAFTDSGNLAGSSLPGSVCITVKFGTAQRGRSARGRNYISGLSEGDVTGNAISQARADGIVNAYVNVEDEVSGVNFAQHVVVSLIGGGLPRVNGLVQNVIEYQVVDLNIDSQRRRLTGRGT